MGETIVRQYLRVKSCYSISPPLIIPTHFTLHYIEMSINTCRPFFFFFFRKRKEEWTKNSGRVEEIGEKKAGGWKKKVRKKRVAGEGFRLCHANQKINFASPNRFCKS